MYGYVLVWYILSSSQLYNSLHTQGFFPLSILKGKYFLTTLKKGKKIFKVNIYFGENCMVLKKFFKEKGPFKEIIPRKGAFKLLKKEKKPWHHLGDMAILIIYNDNFFLSIWELNFSLMNCCWCSFMFITIFECLLGLY